MQGIWTENPAMVVSTAAQVNARGVTAIADARI